MEAIAGLLAVLILHSMWIIPTWMVLEKVHRQARIAAGRQARAFGDPEHPTGGVSPRSYSNEHEGAWNDNDAYEMFTDTEGAGE